MDGNGLNFAKSRLSVLATRGICGRESRSAMCLVPGASIVGSVEVDIGYETDS